MVKFSKRNGSAKKLKDKNDVLNAIRHTVIYGDDAASVRRVIDDARMVFDGPINCFIGNCSHFPSFNKAHFVGDMNGISESAFGGEGGVVLVDYLDDSTPQNADGENILNHSLLMKLANGSRQTFFLVKDQLSLPRGMFVTATPNYISYVQAEATLRPIIKAIAESLAINKDQPMAIDEQKDHECALAD